MRGPIATPTGSFAVFSNEHRVFEVPGYCGTDTWYVVPLEQADAFAEGLEYTGEGFEVDAELRALPRSAPLRVVLR